MDAKYIKNIVAGVCRAAEENNIGICIESVPEDTTAVCNDVEMCCNSSNRICDNLPSLSFFNVKPIHSTLNNAKKCFFRIQLVMFAMVIMGLVSTIHCARFATHFCTQMQQHK